MNIAGWADVFRTNVAAPALMAQVYLPLVERGRRKIIAHMSSSFASFELGAHEQLASYSITKTALNMLVSLSWLAITVCTLS